MSRKPNNVQVGGRSCWCLCSNQCDRHCEHSIYNSNVCPSFSLGNAVNSVTNWESEEVMVLEKHLNRKNASKNVG